MVSIERNVRNERMKTTQQTHLTTTKMQGSIEAVVAYVSCVTSVALRTLRALLWMETTLLSSQQLR